MVNCIALVVLMIPVLYKLLRERRWYMYLLFSLYPIMPDAFAIELSEKLPLLTFSRIILLVDIVIWIILDRKKISEGIKNIGKKKPSVKSLEISKILIIFWAINILISIIHVFDKTGEINKIFNIIFHQIFLVNIIKRFVNTKEEFVKCIDFMILGFMVSCIAGLLQTVFSIDPSEPIMMVLRGERIGLNERMGLSRARGFCTSPIMFACECGFFAILSLYLFELKKSSKYMTSVLICIAGIAMSMTRSAMLGLGLVFIVFFISRFKVAIKLYIKYICIALVIGLAVIIFVPKVGNVILEPLKSALNSIGFNFKISPNFGDNVNNPVGSRFDQWTLLIYMLQNGSLLIGYGYNAYVNGFLHFHYRGQSGWSRAQALDVGFVTVLGENGIIGMLNYAMLYIGIGISSFINRKKGTESELNFYNISIFAMLYFAIMNIASSCIDIKSFWLFVGLWIVYDSSIRKHKWDYVDDSENDKPKKKLSIAIMAYNHEKYIERAIRSVLAQKMDFDYEVWINEDGSSDGTREIIKRIEPEFPDNFHVIYREKNIGALASFHDIYYNRLKGEYFATLEGDDYWINPDKLSVQVKFLDEHPEYMATAHNVQVIDENGDERTDYKYPECKREEYTLKDFQNGILSGQTASMVCRNYYINKKYKTFWCSVKWSGDTPKNFMLASYGKIRCFQEKWSAYRYVTSSGDSYSATFVRDKDMETRYLTFHRELYEYALNDIKEYESIKTAEVIYIHALLTAVIKKKVDNVSIKDYFKAFLKAQYKGSCIAYTFKTLITKR